MRHPELLAILALTACGGGDKPPESSTGVPTCAAPATGQKVAMRQIGQIADAAVLATSPPGDPRLFVVGQQGAIRIISAEQLLPEPFLDLSADARGPVLAGG